MPPPAESRFQTAKAIEGLPREHVPGAVRFAVGGYSLCWVQREGEEPKRVIRCLLHAGQAIEIAFPGDMAVSLGAALLEGGTLPRRLRKPRAAE